MSLGNALSLSRNTLPAFAAVGIAWGAFAAFVPEIKATIGASDAAFGFVLLMTAIGAMSSMLLSPWFGRLFGRYALAVLSLCMVIAFQFPMWTSAIVPFALFMLAVGACSGSLDVITNARLSQIESDSGRSLMNLNHAGFSFAYAAGALATGLAREAEVSPAAEFAVIALVVGLLARAMIQPRQERAADKARQENVSPMSRAVFWGGLVILVGFLSEQAVESWSALHIERTLMGRAAQGALGPAMLGLTMGIGRFSGQIIVARISEAGVIRYAAMLSSLGAGVAAAAPNPLIAYIGFATLGLGVSVIAPMAFALIGRLVTAAERPRAISRAAVLGYFGFFIGPPTLGYLSEWMGLRMSFALVALLLLAIPALLVALRRA